MSLFDDDFGMDDALLLGTGYALYRHGQDQQVEALANALRQNQQAPPQIVVIQEPHEIETVKPVLAAPNALDFINDAERLLEWEDFIGQGPLKEQAMVRLSSAAIRGVRLPHTLLASGYAGVGKTTLARLLARMMGVHIVELVPPFKASAIVEAALELNDGDVLFVDEIHKLADMGKRGAEFLLKILEEHWVPIDGRAVMLPDVTVIGGTTDRDKLPETVVDRFKFKPYFQAYDGPELVQIAVQFAWRHEFGEDITKQLASAMADACRGTPRVIEEMVLACRDLNVVHGTLPTVQDMLTDLELEPDGLTRTHAHYLTALRQYYAREARDGESVEYIAGEAAMQQILRETSQGIGRIERFLVERGLIDRTPRGRRLTDLGIQRAEQLIANGKGVQDV